MNQRSMRWRILISILCSLLFPLLLVSQPSLLDQSLFSLFGGCYTYGDVNIMSLLVSFLPVLTTCIFLGEYLPGRFDSMVVYIFTRTPRRGLYLMKQMGRLCGWLGIFYVLYTAVSLILLLIFCKPGPFSLPFLLLSLSLGYLNLLTVVLAINLAGLYLSPAVAGFLVLGLYLLPIFLSLPLKGTAQQIFFFVFPSLQGIFCAHADTADFIPAGMTVAKPVEGFFLAYSFLYLAVCVLLLFGLGYRTAEKRELLRWKEGAES